VQHIFNVDLIGEILLIFSLVFLFDNGVGLRLPSKNYEKNKII